MSEHRFTQFDWPLQSAVEGLKWPAILPPAGANLLALLYQFEKSQWWPESTLRQATNRQLCQLIEFASRNSPYYSRTVPPDFATEESVLNRWSEAPILTRINLQDNFDDVKTSNLPKSHGRTFPSRTSGSTGMPVSFIATDLTALFWQAISLRERQWHNHNLSGKLAAIRFSDTGQQERHEDNWGAATAGWIKTGPAVMLDIQTNTEGQLNWLVNENPDYLLTHPSVLRDLAILSLDSGVILPNLKSIQTIAENLDAEVRNLCDAAWGVGIVDSYSTREVGYVALQCPEHDHYHIQAESLYVEILDDDNRPCRPGEIGRVIVTDLHNFATPLIRYELGDYAEVGSECDCGRTLPVIKRICGRSRNVATHPDGSRHWPVLDYNGYRKIVPYRQLQVVQTSLEKVEVRMVCDSRPSTQQEQRMVPLIQSSLGYPFKVSYSYPEKIPRSAGGKFEDFRSEI